ncbi:MAG: DUF3108 domain-containing protein [Bacteroidales bacterium]
MKRLTRCYRSDGIPGTANEMIKRTLIPLLGMALLISAGFTFRNLPGQKNNAFKKGEKLIYRVYYDAILTGKVTAGEVTFEVKEGSRVINGRNTHHIQVLGKTKGAFNLFYKVDDRYETYLDEELLLPRFFVRRVDEGGYIIRQNVTFHQEKNKATFQDLKRGRTSVIETPDNVHDVLSMIYYARSLDLANAKTGDSYSFNFVIDDTVYSSSMEILGRETIRTSMGHVRCIKIKPQLVTGNVFKDKYAMELYVSDDRNKLPILMKTGVVVGNVKMELTAYSNLTNNFDALVPKKK